MKTKKSKGKMRGPVPVRVEKPGRRSLIAAGRLAAPTMADTLGRPKTGPRSKRLV